MKHKIYKITRLLRLHPASSGQTHRADGMIRRFLSAMLAVAVAGLTGCRSYTPGIQKGADGTRPAASAIAGVVHPGDRAALAVAVTRNEVTEAALRWAQKITVANSGAMGAAATTASAAGMTGLSEAAKTVGKLNQQIGADMANRIQKGELMPMLAPPIPVWQQDDYYRYGVCPAMLAEMEKVLKASPQFTYVGIDEVKNRSLLEKLPGPDFAAEAESFVLTNNLNFTIRLKMLHSIKLATIFSPSHKAMLICQWEVRPVNGDKGIVIQTVNHVVADRIEPRDLTARPVMLELARQAATDFAAMVSGNPPVYGRRSFSTD